MRPVTGRPALLRTHNRAMLLSALRHADTVSRADLARDLGLAVPTVSRLIDELINEQLVQEVGAAGSRGGRPPTLLRLRPDGAAVLGAELSRDGIRVLAADLRAQVLASAEAKRNGAPDEDIRIVAQQAAWLLSELRVGRERVIGMGVGLPGPLNTERGLVLEAPDLPNWSFIPVRERLAALLNMRVAVDNNANLAAYSEHLFRHSDVPALLYVHAGAGVGAGMVLDGHLYRGRANSVGEIGHSAIDLDGPLCACGQAGCLEALASAKAMLAAYHKIDQSAVKDLPATAFAELLDAERSGQESATSALSAGGRALGVGLSTLVNVLDPELIVMGGAAVASDAYRSVAIDEMRRRTYSRTERDIKVEVSCIGRQAVALGAAALILQPMFVSPLAPGATGV